MSKAGFRDDINGLRALAILVVMAFHFKLPGVGGGFAGVDVFFAVSGFLMTEIIQNRFDAGLFSLGSFYMARVRRIVPALLVLCALLVLFGLFGLDPIALEGLAGEAATALLFVSNFLLAAKSGGYFAAAPESHWLLHTWSLSVEWQFYLFYPLLFVILKAIRLPARYTPAVIAGIALLSLVLAQVLTIKVDSPIKWYFFMLPNRAWEMLAGGLVALGCRRWQPTGLLGVVLHYLGLGIIAASSVFVTEELPWPSVFSVPVVAGACLVLVAGRTHEAWARFLPVRLLGKWSYSIYLWHWPLLAAVTTFGLAMTPALGISLFALSVAVGFVSFELVEKRLTRLLFKNHWPAKLLPSLAVVLAACGATLATHGLEMQRTPDATRLAALREARAAMGDWDFRSGCTGGLRRIHGLEYCQIGNPKVHDVLVIGDSHAQQLIPRYAGLMAKAPGHGVLFITKGGCMPMRGVSRGGGYEACGKAMSEAYDVAMTGAYSRVVIVALWNGYLRGPKEGASSKDICFETADGCAFFKNNTAYYAHLRTVLQGFSRDIDSLRQKGVRVTVTDVIPAGDNADPRRLYTRIFFGGALLPDDLHRHAFDHDTSGQRQPIIAAARAGGADIVTPADRVCANDICPTHDGNRLLYHDGAHIRGTAAKDVRYGYLDSTILPGLESMPHPIAAR